MAIITLKYDARNRNLRKALDLFISLGATVISDKPKKRELDSAIDDVENGRVNTYKSVDDFFKKNKLD